MRGLAVISIILVDCMILITSSIMEFVILWNFELFENNIK